MASRVSIPRSRGVSKRSSSWILRLDVRLAVFAAALFFAGCLLAASLAPPSDLARPALVATAWGNQLMRGSVATDYGWIPSEESAAEVDLRLREQGAAFLLLDLQRRVVAASERLTIERAVLMIPTTGGTATIAPMGEVEVTQVPISVFGVPQGTLVLLSAVAAASELRPPNSFTSAEVPRLGVAGLGLSLPFLLLGAVLTGLGVFVFAHAFVTSRILGLTQIAQQPIDGSRPPRRFAPGDLDELSEFARTLNVMRRRTHVLLASMTARENRRRDWLSELSHDLRTPIAALILRLEKAVRSGSDFERREALALALRDCNRIETLASGFIDLAQLEVTEGFNFESVMPEELIGQVVSGLRPISEEASVEVTTDVDPQPTVHADGHRLRRALENLLRNAIRHAKERVVVGADHHGDELRFFVRDDGSGFSELTPGQEVELRDWHGRAQAGGLGLRVADRVARAHGGRLLLRNGENGTEVSCVIRIQHDERSETIA